MSETLTDSGSQADINLWTECLRLISSIRISLFYDSILNDNRTNKWLYQEYIAWHNLVEAMAYYLDYLSTVETYKAVPEEKNKRIKAWLDSRMDCLEREKKILNDNLLYTMPSTITDSLKDRSDFDKLFSYYHLSYKPYCYHPFWNEIKTSFDEWNNSRTKVADQLTPYQSLSYREYSREVAYQIFSFIKDLDVTMEHYNFFK